MQQEIDSKEFTEWRAFDKIHPLRDHRSDYNAANIAATIANVMSLRRTPFKVSEFLLDFGEKRRPSGEELEKKAMVIAKMINAEKGG